MEQEYVIEKGFSKKEWILLLVGLVCIFDTLLCVNPEFDIFGTLAPPIGRLWIKYGLGVQVIGGSVKLLGFVCLLILGILCWKKEKKRWLLFGCVLPAINCVYYICYIAVVLGITVFQSPFLTDLSTHMFHIQDNWEWQKYQIWIDRYWASLYLSYFVRILTGVFWLVYTLKKRRESTDGRRKSGCFSAVLIASLAVNILVLDIFTIGYVMQEWCPR